MLRLLNLIFTILFFSVNGYSRDLLYPSSEIPDELIRSDIVAVIRNHTTNIKVVSESKFEQTEKYIITILDKRGAKYCYFKEYYDDFSSLSNISIKLYDSAGKRIGKLSGNNIRDIGLNGNDIANDNRVKFYKPNIFNYPFTFEYEYTRTYKSLFYLQGWSSYEKSDIAVENSLFTLLTPSDIKINYKSYNTENEPEIKVNPDSKEYKWSVSNFIPYKTEEFSPFWRNIYPYVNISPQTFSLSGYEGEMTSWNEFATWIAELNSGRDILDESVIKELNTLIKDIDCELGKIETVYKYMQSKTRYVSIQLGIGGLQPFEAQHTNKKGYGDCKALTLYMQALLKSVGIKSNYCLINGGYWGTFIDSTFPANYFNHVILQVPLNNDTLWLECTSQTDPCGFIAGFTDDRWALVIDNNGGYLNKTKKYSKDENVKSSSKTIIISNDGNVKSSIKKTYSGIYYAFHKNIEMLNNNERESYFNDLIPFGNFVIDSSKYFFEKNFKPELNLNFSVTVNKYAQVSDSRMIIPLNYSNSESRVSFDEQRNTDMYFHYSASHIDTTKYIYPKEYSVEYMPELINYNSKYGTYNFKCEKKEDSILCIRKLDWTKMLVPKSEFDEVYSFYKNIAKIDNKKILLQKQ